MNWWWCRYRRERWVLANVARQRCHLSCLLCSSSSSSSSMFSVQVKRGTHWQHSWIQHGWLCWKSTVADTVNFVAGFGNKSATTWIRQLVAVDFVASVYGAKATRSTLSTFNEVDRVEFNFVASVYRALGVQMTWHVSSSARSTRPRPTASLFTVCCSNC